jgi:hypothetical protein
LSLIWVKGTITGPLAAASWMRDGGNNPVATMWAVTERSAQIDVPPDAVGLPDSVGAERVICSPPSSAILLARKAEAIPGGGDHLFFVA